MCSVQNKSSITVTPKSWCQRDASMYIPCPGVRLPKCNIRHLSTFGSKIQSWHHRATPLRSPWSWAELDAAAYNFVSSVNNKHADPSRLERSAIYREKTMGLKAEPCRTPLSTDLEVDLASLILTWKERQEINGLVHSNRFPLISRCSSFCNERLCGTRSKAYEKSRFAIVRQQKHQGRGTGPVVQALQHVRNYGLSRWETMLVIGQYIMDADEIE